MKKITAILLALLMTVSLAACGSKDGSSGKGETSSTGGTGTTTSDPLFSEEDLEDVDNALEILEALTPEGWDENSYGAYIYDVWDEEFLPDILPGPVDGVKPSQTNFKDYKHDVLNSNYAVGPLYFDTAEDYREYSVSFYATNDQLNAYLDSVKAKGFTGGETSSFDDEWREFYYSHPDGWFMYLFFNTNDDDGGAFDGCASVSLTDDISERPVSIGGVALPRVGAPYHNMMEYSYYETYNFDSGESDSVQVDWNGNFPNSEECSWWVFLSYYGVEAQQAMAYKDSLVAQGWEVQWSNDSSYDPAEGYYNSALLKDDVYMVVNCYNNTQLEIGFSDMVENISY